MTIPTVTGEEDNLPIPLSFFSRPPAGYFLLLSHPFVPLLNTHEQETKNKNKIE